jgi:hypothetical protein
VVKDALLSQLEKRNQKRAVGEQKKRNAQALASAMAIAGAPPTKQLKMAEAYALAKDPKVSQCRHLDIVACRHVPTAD